MTTILIIAGYLTLVTLAGLLLGQMIVDRSDEWRDK